MNKNTNLCCHGYLSAISLNQHKVLRAWIDSPVEALPGSVYDMCVTDELGGGTLIDPYFVYEKMWTDIINPFNFHWQFFDEDIHMRYLVKVVAILQDQLAFWEMDIHTALCSVFLAFQQYVETLQAFLDHLLE